MPTLTAVVSGCACGHNGDWTACINGFVYGPCEDENCGGVCETTGECDHSCHTANIKIRESV